MPTFVTLTNYTADGLATLADLEAEEFLQMSEAEVEDHGGELKDFYLTMGQYDAVVVTEFPDAEAATRAILSIIQDGIAETETLRAFTEAESREIVGDL